MGSASQNGTAPTDTILGSIRSGCMAGMNVPSHPYQIPLILESRA